ncbi:MAG: hypothetical protein IKL46_00175 [Clostridia bacterium]|nr:hypothetical protein [Clostridia bacterium]
MFENTIYKQAQDAPTDSFKVSFNNTTLITDTIARGYLTKKYHGFRCADLVETFNFYVSMTASDLSRALTAWNATYNPLDNYNGKEKRINIESYGKETDTRSTDENHNTVRNEILDGSKTDNYTTTYDNASPRLESRQESQGGSQSVDDLTINNEKEFTNTSLTIDGETFTAHEVRGEIYEKAGNLGVTTSQQMIMSEVEMRLNPVIKQYLDKFIYEYAYYVGGCHLWL